MAKGKAGGAGMQSSLDHRTKDKPTGQLFPQWFKDQQSFVAVAHLVFEVLCPFKASFPLKTIHLGPRFVHDILSNFFF